MGFEEGLSGLNAASHNLDVIGNNVANANTVGFKSSTAVFADVYAAALGSGSKVGLGTVLSTVAQQFTQGNITTTNNPLDIAINGAGFFRLDHNGAIEYSRNGQFQLDKNGFIVNANGEKLTGYGVDVSGNVLAGTPTLLQISTADIAPIQTSKAAIGLNLDSRAAVPATATFSINDPTSYNNATSLTTYDSLGNPHTLTTYYVKSSTANQWSIYVANDGTLVSASPVGTLKFKSSGTLDAAASGVPYSISVPLTNGAATPLAYKLDFSNSTQFGSGFNVSSLTQDGAAAGKLLGVSIAADGTMQGRYSNGQTKAIGQVVLTNFSNPQGLQPLGNNTFGETAASGQPLVGGPGAGSLGVLQSGAVEESNVDLTAELVDMITAQRFYQANAQTIKTQDAVLNTLVNLR